MDNQNSSPDPPPGGFRPSFMGPPSGRSSQAPSSTPTSGSVQASQSSLSGIDTSFIDELIGLDGWAKLLRLQPTAPPQARPRPNFFPCDICGLAFSSIQTLEAHKQTHGPYYVCLICPDDSPTGKERFPSQVLLNDHLRKAHRRRALKWDALNHVEVRYEDQDKFRSVTTTPRATPSQAPVPTGSGASSRTGTPTGSGASTGATQPILPSHQGQGVSGDRGSTIHVSNPTKAKVDAVAPTMKESPPQLRQLGPADKLGRIKKRRVTKGEKVKNNLVSFLETSLKKLDLKQSLAKKADQHSTASNAPKKAMKRRSAGKLESPTEKGMDEAAQNEKLDGHGQSKKMRLEKN